jgi:hypothetical protein
VSFGQNGKSNPSRDLADGAETECACRVVVHSSVGRFFQSCYQACPASGAGHTGGSLDGLVRSVWCVRVVFFRWQAHTSFHFSAGGRAWSTNQNWGTGDPCANHWQGVTCPDGSTVTVLNLFSAGVSCAQLPTAFFDLPTLQELCVAGGARLHRRPASLSRLCVCVCDCRWSVGALPLWPGCVPRACVRACVCCVAATSMRTRACLGQYPTRLG